MARDIRILESTIDEDKFDASRWQKYGKDRLYINMAGSSHDGCFVDLAGDEGHSTWASASFEVDGGTVTIEWDAKHGYAREENIQTVVVEVVN